MNVTVIRGRELTPELTSLWRTLQESNAALASPYFCPEFTQAVAAVRNNVFVGLLEDGGDIVGFFPFQRGRWGTGVPVGGRMSDYHGVVAEPTTVFCPEALIRDCKLGAWDFDHLIAEQTPFVPLHAARSESPIIEIPAAIDDYLTARRRSGSRLVEKTQKLRDKMEREVGRVRFEVHVPDSKMLHSLIEWKSEQYRRTGLVDLFQFSWARELLERVFSVQTGKFAGMLSVLYAGDEVVAMHMGMRSQTVWHWWFPSYNAALAKYSPGRALLLNSIEHAAGGDIRVIDLGKGDAAYKRSFMTSSVALAEGSVVVGVLLRALRGVGRSMLARARSSPLAGLGRGPARVVRRIARWQTLR